MQLNIDCIRDVLLELEKMPLESTTSVQALYDSLDYPYSDVLYSCAKLNEAGYIRVIDSWWGMDNKPYIEGILDITFDGHEFLANIKEPSHWAKISSAFKQGGSASLKAVGNAALELGTEVLKAKLGLK